MALHELTARQAAEGVAKGDFSPVELVQAHLDRIAATEPAVQAWEAVDAEGALNAARAAESRARERAITEPLFGVPVGIKDNWDVRGLATTANFAPYRDRIADRDSAVTQFFRDAGAIIVGKTVTVQFATGLDSPKTANPWNLECTPGGSSSGSAAAVGAQQVPITVGTQTGGSLLRPAAYCGVVGLKPTFGRISRYGLLPVSWSLDEPGIITKSVEDAAMVLQAIGRHDPRDPYSVAHGQDDFLAAADSPKARPRLGLIVDLLERADPDVRTTAEQTAGKLAAAGAVIEEVRLPVELDVLLAIHFLHRASEAAAVHGEQYATQSEHYRPDISANIEVGSLIPASVYVHASRLRRRYRSQMVNLFQGFDALIGPTASNVAPKRAINTGDPSFQVFLSLFGLPNISLPTAVGDRGLPHALQFVERPFREANLLSVASWAESVIGQVPLPKLHPTETRH